jgi:hypothetical protein
MYIAFHSFFQCVLPGNNRNEIEVQFPESDTLEQGTDQLGTHSYYVQITHPNCLNSLKLSFHFVFLYTFLSLPHDYHVWL